MLLEIACFNLGSCLIAQRSGAHRVELCENYSEGGISPSPELIQKVKQELHIPVFVMIRPRPGNFIYSDDEFQVMKMQVLYCKEKNVMGLYSEFSQKIIESMLRVAKNWLNLQNHSIVLFTGHLI